MTLYLSHITFPTTFLLPSPSSANPSFKGVLDLIGLRTPELPPEPLVSSDALILIASDISSGAKSLESMDLLSFLGYLFSIIST